MNSGKEKSSGMLTSSCLSQGLIPSIPATEGINNYPSSPQDHHCHSKLVTTCRCISLPRLFHQPTRPHPTRIMDVNPSLRSTSDVALCGHYVPCVTTPSVYAVDRFPSLSHVRECCSPSDLANVFTPPMALGEALHLPLPLRSWQHCPGWNTVGTT